MTTRWIVAIVAVPISLAACGGAKPANPPAGGGTGDPMAQHGADPAGPASLDAVEARLLAAPAIEISFDIESKGQNPAAVKGDVRMTRDNRVRWRVSGTFDGKPVSIDRMLDATAGAHLTEAIVIGWTRMGLLHNIAMLATGNGVEHAGGGIADWVTATTTASDAESITVDLAVAGHKTSTGRLELDGLGLPRQRALTVHFPAGDMMVEEHYSVGLPDAFTSDVFAGAN